MRKTFQPAFDIWQIPPYMRGMIQPGQWVFAGERSSLGVYLGQGKAGTDVVAWRGNFPRNGARKYIKTLRQYAKGIQ